MSFAVPVRWWSLLWWAVFLFVSASVVLFRIRPWRVTGRRLIWCFLLVSVGWSGSTSGFLHVVESMCRNISSIDPWFERSKPDDRRRERKKNNGRCNVNSVSLVECVLRSCCYSSFSIMLVRTEEKEEEEENRNKYGGTRAIIMARTDQRTCIFLFFSRRTNLAEQFVPLGFCSMKASSM